MFGRTNKFMTILLTAAVFTACMKPFLRWDPGSGVLFKPVKDPGISRAVEEVEKIEPPKVMRGPGLVGAMGGVHLKAQGGGVYDLRLPVPQLADRQAPVFYTVFTEPPGVLKESRLQPSEDGNFFINMKMEVKRGEEVRVRWCGAVLVSEYLAAENVSVPGNYLEPTECSQGADPRIVELAGRMWPETGDPAAFAANVQGLVMRLKPSKQPTSLDALSILDSGVNSICTGNANLACSLFRAKKIPCRSVATLPAIPRRFEMHRVVEYHHGGKWTPFDPSCVFMDIPLKPWQNVIMAKTTIADEKDTMKPRTGAMYGCPFGQEAEIFPPGLNLFGNDFFWTIAAPLAEFEVSEGAALNTAELWRTTLKDGVIDEKQVAAAMARDKASFESALGEGP